MAGQILKTAAFLAAALCTAAQCAAAVESEFGARDRAVVAIAAQTAVGDLDALERAFNAGLDAGLTINEVKEILVQLYAYTGFPRSLNAINRFMRVVDARAAAGRHDEPGREASPVPPGLDRDAYGAQMRAKLGGRPTIPPPSGYQLFAPAIDAFLKEHLFCDVFIRDNLDHRSRELATIGALAGLPGTDGQMVFHMNAAMNTGTDAAGMRGFVEVVRSELGEERAQSAERVLAGVLARRTAAR